MANFRLVDEKNDEQYIMDRVMATAKRERQKARQAKRIANEVDKAIALAEEQLEKLEEAADCDGYT